MKKCKLLSLLFASALLFGCASDDVDLDNMTAEQLYNRAHDYLDETRFKKAAETLALDRFFRFHPGNPNVAYAYYLKAICYYDQISDVNREQGETRRALEAFNQLVARFPDSKYAADARQKMVLARDNLAGKEMEVGRYYLNQKNYLSALNRFSAVVNNYK